MTEILGLILMGIGLFFNFAGTLGLLRLPDVYSRLHAANKAVTLGTSSILLGVFFMSPASQEGLKALLCMLFLLLTAPAGAHALAKGAYHYGVPMWSGSVVDRYGPDIRKVKK